MRKLIIAANWKMNKTSVEAEDFMESFLSRALGYDDIVEIVIAPPFTLLQKMVDLLKEENASARVLLAAQDLYWEESGAFTGEVSAEMLVDVGCRYVIIGHSERRQYFGETNETVQRKLMAAIKHGLKPIFCVGETESERREGKTFDVVDSQISESLDGFEASELEEFVIAYEPIWAIGTGLTATPEQAQEVHAFIRERLAVRHGSEVSDRIRIQYGGSVKPSNIRELMSQNDIDGALVGGASLDADSFFDIISFDKQK